jgi:serine/threonine protein kinase/WD40 repeat protein/DNA-binding SARP family transcriptional activator
MAQRADVAKGLESRDEEETLRISLLGPLSVSRDGSSLEVTGPKRRALLSLLALHAGTPVGRDRIIEALWPRGQTGREDSTLRVHVSHLRDELEPERGGEPTFLITHGASYMLDRSAVELDIDEFDDLTREARSLLAEEPGHARRLLDRALGLWRGRPLQDFEYEEFVQDEIRRLDQARIEAVQNRAEALVELGEPAAAVEDLEGLVRSDPTRERAVTLLMTALYRAGRQADALRAARRHVRVLAETGLEPSPQLSVLEERILRHDPELLPPGMVSPDDIAPGRSVRGYELRDVAGSGSIGVVYRAFQPAVGRQVAVKVVHPELAQTPDFVRRFAEEARVIASLEHPHIVPLHDFWREPGGAFLVMRWMDGGSLGDWIGKRWDDAELARVFDQLADALGYAHSAGVVHRDVKPGNVLFDATGNVYLCDFGLAAAGVETGIEPRRRRPTIEPPYASPELIRGEGPTVASDIYGLGVLLAEVVSVTDSKPASSLGGDLREVVQVATAENPADRYPDMTAFRLALRDAIGTTTAPAARRVRRNPYKGLAPFDEGDSADFYGRDDVIESIVDVVGRNGLTAIIGASGSGKSSLAMAGVVPALRDGVLPGSDEWSLVHMVPGIEPFEEFHIGLREAAVGYPSPVSGDSTRELRRALTEALDGPNRKAMLVVDQFEELFSSAVDHDLRERFLENLVDLASDRRFKVLLTLRADFSDRPLAHPRFGDLVSKASLLLAPMRPDQIEDVIRRPAARVGVQVEPGLISEIVRDVSNAPAYLPLLQYVLSELFERRVEDRLTVHAYRSLGGVQGVLERQAEATFTSLDAEAQRACRQLFLRMVQLGDHGEETRRRVPLTELSGLGPRLAADAALEAFSTARLVTYDRDPVSRTPTVEVAHETVITRWTRYRIWIDEARSDLLAHRRLSAAADTWAESSEDPSYLLTGGPLVAALDLRSGDRVRLNDLETRFVEESLRADATARSLEEDRRREEAALRTRAKRRLALGVGTAAIAIIVGAVAIFAFVQRQRANDLAALQERQSVARELAAASITNLDSADPDLSLLLAIESALQSLNAGEKVLPEAVDALHRALINPRSEVLVDGAGQALGGNVLDYSEDGGEIVVLANDGGAFVVDPSDGGELGRVRADDSPGFGVDFHPGGDKILTTHADAVREWDWRTGRMTRQLSLSPGVNVATAIYSNDGSQIAIGGDDGTIRVFVTVSGRMIAELAGHEEAVTAVAFDNSGARLVSAGDDQAVLVWDVATGNVTADLLLPFGPVGQAAHVAWNPVPTSPFAPNGAFGVTTDYGEMWLYQATGERVNSFGNGGNPSRAVEFSPDGSFMVAAGADGIARLYGSWTGGEEAITLPTGGVPLRDAAFNPAKQRDFEVATVGVDGEVRIWRDLGSSELPDRDFAYIGPDLAAMPSGDRYVVTGRVFWYGLPDELVPQMEVIDVSSGETLVSRPSLESALAGKPAISQDGRFVSFTGPTGGIEIIEVDTRSSRTLSDSAGRDIAQAFSPDGAILATAGWDGQIAIWDTSTGEMMNLLQGHGDRVPINVSEPGRVNFVEQVGFRPNSDELASVGYDGTVRVWNPVTGATRVLRSFDYELSSMAYSPDGSRMAVAERTGEIHVLDSDTGTDLFLPEPVSGPPRIMVFSPDGSLLAAAGPGPFAHLWEMEEGRLVRRIRGSVYAPMSVAFVNDGTELIVLATEGILRRYALEPVDLVDLARAEVSSGLTDAECLRYLRRACD